MLIILRIAILLALFAPALLLTTCIARANAADLCRQDGYGGELYGCAKNAFGKGRCVIYIKPDKLEHE